MKIPERQGIFIHSLSNRDPLDIVTRAREINCDWIAVEVVDNFKDMNLKLGLDVLLPAIFKHANGLKIWCYHNVILSDPAKEAKVFIKRVASYVTHPSFGGLMVRIMSDAANRTDNAANVYLSAVMQAYPTVSIGLVDTSLAPLNIVTTFLKRVDFLCSFTLTWELATNRWLDYTRFNAMPAKFPFIPMIPISSYPGYTFSPKNIREMYQKIQNDDQMTAGAYWNWTPEDGGVGIYSDGNSNENVLKELKWVKPINEVIPPTKPIESEVGLYTEGIDTSHWESDIYWDKVAKTKKFVWCKATESYTYADPEYKKDIQAAKAAGMLVGSYHFFRWAGDTMKQTRFFLDTIKGMPMDLPCVVDIEENNIGYGAANYQTAIKLCLDTIEKETGRKPIVYTSDNFWKNTGRPAWSKDYPLWVAHYTTATAPIIPVGWDKWTFWQYSEAGKIDGIPYDGVDLNRFNGSYLDLLSFCKIPTVPVIPEYTDPEKLQLLWNDHPLLHK